MFSFFDFLLLVLALFLGGMGFFLFGKVGQGKKAKIDQKKGTAELVYDTIAGLTAISGVRSSLDYLGESLQKLGFSQVLIFLVDKEKRILRAEVALGFKEDLEVAKLKLPLNSKGGTLVKSLLEDKFLVVEETNEWSEKLEFKTDLGVGSFLVAPIARKSEERCWEVFHCTRTTCPAYEQEDPRCWLTPQTRCGYHLKKNYDDRIFADPDDKLAACLNCERFRSLGVILVSKRELVKFSAGEKKLFRMLAYQSGAKLEKAYLLANLEDREREITRRMYELSILKELGERIGYSLNTQKIADIITGSLKKLIDYSAASYMLIDPDQKKLLFKCQLEESVSREFVSTVKERMLAGLSVLLGKELKKEEVDESLAGTILDETVKDPVRSFFNIPLTLGERVVGMLNVASTRSGLYKEDEMTILYKITAQASNAVTRLQEVLDSEQRKLNAMVSSMADGVLMIDKENRIYVVNPKVREMLRMTKPEILIFDIIDALSGKIDFRTKFEESIKLDRLVVVEEVYVPNRFLRILFSPVKDKSGEILGAVIIFHDITHDKEIEKMREDFTSMMVHDLRSPLNGIRLLSELLKKRKLPKVELQESVQLINSSSSNMLELVNDLLDVAKLESGKFIVDKQLDDLKETLEGRVNFFKPLASDKKINLSLKVADDLPKVKFDRKEIDQVLDNLLANAIKFTEAGGKVVLQALILRPGENIESLAQNIGFNWLITKDTKGLNNLSKETVLCAITDTGSGIPEEQISRLFNKFEQVESKYQKEAKGTGLGLVIAKGIVEAHSGIIGVESKVDKGSTFFFTLPLK